MTIVHTRTLYSQNFFDDAPNPPARQVFLTVANPGIHLTLIRTRLQIDMRVRAYSQGDSANPPEYWYRNLFPVVGVLYQAAPFVPPGVDDPIGGAEDLEWVIWGRLEGRIEEVQTSTAGFRRYVNRWSFPGGVCESFAQRQPGLMATQSVWLGWNWHDTANLINRTHGSFDVVYDLAVDATIDLFWKPRP